jgi:hypothetical protein
MATPQQQEALYRQGRVDLATQAYKTGQIQSLRRATDTYDAPRTTARRRIAGIAPRRGSPAPNRLLTPTQEEALKQWILSMDQRGMPPTPITVQQMAGILAAL